ncbi:hypothetical protein [Sphingosinicella sp.]|uniref:hypothetical protein n=1 Tax=Sphingosinicella sp. TaxID=1917971 RepID=UPI0040380B00
MNDMRNLQLTFVMLAAVVSGPAMAQSGGRGPGAGNPNDPNRLICRRMPETGSLAATRRQCYTRAEWDRIAESQQSGAQRVIDGLTTRPGGN